MKKSYLLGAVCACLAVASLNANAVSVLYGVTGDGATTPETLYTVSITDASMTFVQTLGNGFDGESIAYHTTSGLMYHWSGIGIANIVMETINLNNGTVTNITQDYTNYDPTEVFGSTYDPVTGLFYATDINANLATVSTSGVWNSVGALPTELRGISFFSGSLYAGDKLSNDLYQIDSGTGGSLGSVGVTLGGVAVDGINGLTVDSMTNTLYALIKVGGSRQLATLDPITGIATNVGTFGDKMANIEFTSAVPVPAAVWLFGSGLLGLVGMARRKKAA